MILERLQACGKQIWFKWDLLNVQIGEFAWFIFQLLLMN